MEKDEKFIIAISASDFKKYGCVECNCEYAYNEGGISGGGAVGVKCGECGTSFVILADGVEQSERLGFGAYNGKKFSHAILKGNFAYPIREDHPHKLEKHKFVREDKRPEVGEYFRPRGVGYDLAGFVESKQAGERIVAMFYSLRTENPKEGTYCFVNGDKPAWLDYRESEPLWIQVKIGYTPETKINIEALNILTEEKGIITKEMIAKAKDPKLAKEIVEKHEKNRDAHKE